MTNSKPRSPSKTLLFAAGLVWWAVFFSHAALALDPSTDIQLAKPRIEIPIPGLELADVVKNSQTLTIPWIGQYVAGVYRFLVSIVGVLAASMMMFGGFQYLTAGGDKTKVDAGKKRIVNALMGMILALGSYVLLYAINPDLVQFQAFQLLAVSTETFDDSHDAADAPPESIFGGSSPSATNGKVPLYIQWDSKYNEDLGCGTDNMRSSGCGPTSLSMVLASYGVTMSPQAVEKMFRDNGYKKCSGGTTASAFESKTIVGQFNLVGESLGGGESAKAKIMPLLQQGIPVAVGVKAPSIFTSAGHYIVLVGIDPQGNIIVNDPNMPNSRTYDRVKIAIKPKASGPFDKSKFNCDLEQTHGNFIICQGPPLPQPVSPQHVPPSYIFSTMAHSHYVHPAGAK